MDQFKGLQNQIIWFLARAYVFLLSLYQKHSRRIIWTAARIYVFLRKTRVSLEKQLVWLLAKLYVSLLRFSEGFLWAAKKYPVLLRASAASIAVVLVVSLTVIPALSESDTTIADAADSKNPTDSSIADDWILNQELIAHGLGEMDGLLTTNSREALINSYKAGFRVFETDLIMTTDGVLALRHDNWRFVTSEDGTVSKTFSPMSMEEFRSLKPGDRLTPITFEELVGFMQFYPDIRIITDTKETDLDAILELFEQIEETVNRYDPSLLARITPQFYSEEMYLKMKERFHFSSYIYTLYMSEATPSEVLSFMNREGLRIVTMAQERATPDFISLLDQQGINSCVHTVDTLAELEKFKAMGVDSFYTDNYLK